MTTDSPRILVVQTAFLGDVILALPILQSLRRAYPAGRIDVVVIPRAANIVAGHPAVSSVIVYDKRKADRGIRGFLRIASSVRSREYDIAIVPHRSLRSALLVRWAGIPRRIGFDRSSGSLFWTETVRYRNELHEIDRNLSLLEPFLGHTPVRELPQIVPSPDEQHAAESLLAPLANRDGPLVALAPGTMWKTKQWPEEYFLRACLDMKAKGWNVILVGGPEDAPLCARLAQAVGFEQAVNSAGRLTLRESAALLKRCQVLLTNDSAPMHLAVAVGTPVVAIFGATVPAFGFGPVGPHDVVLETPGLRCRPCSIHGGRKCPIGTFECMLKITPEMVVREVGKLVRGGVSV